VIRVALGEDQALMRQGLTSLLGLASDIELVGEADDGAATVALVRRVQPDVLLLDVRMPRGDAFFVLGELAPPPPTILLTTFDDDEALLRGIRAGARGFLLKDVSLETLLDAIRRVHAGETLIRPAINARVERALAERPPSFERSPLPQPLTRREREVLRLMAAGHSNREIGAALGTSEATVKNQISSILMKLGVRDRTRAVLLALERALI
jgi:DNA-binding NarL/FixJ family response regulator